MANNYDVQLISNIDKKNFNIGGAAEVVSFKIWSKLFPKLAENIQSMKKRGLYQDITI